MSAASSSCQGGYDVFLNFRGKDTRNGFTGHLYEALCNKEIQTFMDADKIVKGEEISPALATAMEKSMFCVVVLSKNYASSTWCLDELVQILECKRDKKQTVLPIFYGVNPSDVLEQKGSFGKAFARLEKKFKEKKERVQIWKQALTEVANICGWDARDRHEPTLIKEIIEHISSRLINRSSKDVKATRKRKINEVKETEIRELRDAKAMEVYSCLEIMVPEISTRLTSGERSEVPPTNKRKIEEIKETKITNASHLRESEPDTPIPPPTSPTFPFNPNSLPTTIPVFSPLLPSFTLHYLPLRLPLRFQLRLQLHLLSISLEPKLFTMER